MIAAAAKFRITSSNVIPSVVFTKLSYSSSFIFTSIPKRFTLRTRAEFRILTLYVLEQRSKCTVLTDSYISYSLADHSCQTVLAAGYRHAFKPIQLIFDRGEQKSAEFHFQSIFQSTSDRIQHQILVKDIVICLPGTQFSVKRDPRIVVLQLIGKPVVLHNALGPIALCDHKSIKPQRQLLIAVLQKSIPAADHLLCLFSV